MVNLSNRELTIEEIKVLFRGLNFCRTLNSIDKFQLKKDIDEFGGRLKLKYHFDKVDKSMDSVKNRRFKDKSKWVPEVNEPMLDLLLKNLELELFSIKESGHNYSTLSYLERRALRNLKESSDIVIKKADKGSAVVVWGLEDYRKEAYRHLKDEKVYEKVLDNPLNKTIALIDGKLQNYAREGKITQANLKYLKGKSLNLGRFYLLPKIHKSLVEVPGKPVVSNCGTSTERITEFVDYHINPILKVLPAVLRDTSDLLRRLERLGHIPEIAIFGTIHVVGLYPHIPHEDGLESMRKVEKRFCLLRQFEYAFRTKLRCLKVILIW